MTTVPGTISWVLPVGFLVAAAAITALWPNESADEDRSMTPVEVVHGGAVPVPLIARRSAEQPAPPVIRPDDVTLSIRLLKQSLISEFPTLKNADINCNRVCVLTARTTATEEAHLADSQLPYMGRLEQGLRQRNFKPVGDLMIEEGGGDNSIIKVSFLRIDQTG